MRIFSTGGVSIGNTLDLGAKSLNVGSAIGVSVGDFVGQVNFQGYAATYGASIKSHVPSGSPGVDYQDLRFHTSAGPSNINVERMRIDAYGVIKPSPTSSTGFVANQYSLNAGNSFTVTLPSVYGVYELAIFAARNDAGAYGSRHQVYHIAGLGGFPRTTWPPVVNLVSDIQRPQTSSPPTVSVSTGVNGVVTVTLGGTAANFSGYALRLLTTGSAY
jgi:hypothetical protein